LSGEKLEISKKELEEIALAFLSALKVRESEVLLRDVAEASLMKKNREHGAWLQQEIKRVRCLPEFQKESEERYQGRRARAREQLQSELPSAASFLKYVLSSVEHFVR